MENNIAIKVQNISKKFQLGNISRGLFSFNKENIESKEFFALKDINFEIKKGDAVGLIGRNGSGKSTLLKLIGGITYPTSGTIDINGSCSIVMESGIGFHKDLSGFDNIFTQGQIMGMSIDYIKSKLEDIIEFSEIREFIHTPLKHYSSGMVSRLSFSVIAILSNEILLLDEVLSFGDVGFHQKAMRKIKELHQQGRTIISISHNLNDILSISNRILVLRNGVLVADGLPSEVIPDYIEEILLAKFRKDNNAKDGSIKNYIEIKENIFNGPNDIKLKSLNFSDIGNEAKMVHPINKPLSFSFCLEVINKSTEWDFGIIVRDITESVIFTSSIFEDKQNYFKNEGELRGTCTIPSNIFNLGTFFIYPYFINNSKKEFLPIKDFISFRTKAEENKINSLNKFIGPIKLRIDWNI